MGKRCEPRTPIELPVRIFGTDAGGKIFSENATTIDVSQHGAKLRGVCARVQLNEIIGVTQGNNKVHFRVKWVGEPGTSERRPNRVSQPDAGETILETHPAIWSIGQFPFHRQGPAAICPGEVFDFGGVASDSTADHLGQGLRLERGGLLCRDADSIESGY